MRLNVLKLYSYKLSKGHEGLPTLFIINGHCTSSAQAHTHTHRKYKYQPRIKLELPNLELKLL